MPFASAFKSGTPVRRGGSTPRARPAGRKLAVTVRAEHVLVVNTKKGGHAFLGLYLAKRLLGKGHTVTILNDGDESLESKAPFSQYPILAKNNPPPRGLNVLYGNPSDPSTYPRGSFDVLVDNNGKSLEECRPLIDTFGNEIKQYIFIGSAGAYVADSTQPMHVEGDERKSSAGHVAVEQYLRQTETPHTVFQPLYMYGEHTAKDCEQWFIDRIIRGRPVPIPAPGNQLTSVSHVEDVAFMIARSITEQRAAIGQHYNACTDRCVTLDGLAQAVAQALGTEADIVHYNPKDFDIPKGKGFPFRAVHFFASTDKAKAELGWAPQHNLMEDLATQVAIYREQGRDKKDVDFSVDDMILSKAR